MALLQAHACHPAQDTDNVMRGNAAMRVPLPQVRVCQVTQDTTAVIEEA